MKRDTRPKPGEKAINIRIPEAVHRRWKVLAFSKGKSMKSLMLEAMTECFEKYGDAKIVQN